MGADVVEVRIGAVLVRQEELDRQGRGHPIPRLPGGVARYTEVVPALDLFKWLRRQYPDQEVSLVGSTSRFAVDVADREAREREHEDVESRQQALTRQREARNGTL